jgi:tetratricopeptide (TPR) repeat protein
VQFFLARVLGWNKDFAESESKLRDWVRAHPDRPEGALQLARILSWEQKYAESAEEYRHVLSARPQDASAHAELSAVLLALGNDSSALDEGRAALSLDPSNAEAAKATIRALTALKDATQARSELDKLQRAHPDDPEIAALRERIETAGKTTPLAAPPAPQPAAAEEYFQQALQKDPNNVDAHLQLADIYAGRKQFSVALAQLRAAASRETPRGRAGPGGVGARPQLAWPLLRVGGGVPAGPQTEPAGHPDVPRVCSHTELGKALRPFPPAIRRSASA